MDSHAAYKFQNNSLSEFNSIKNYSKFNFLGYDIKLVHHFTIAR
jgi:hypothetical protein